MPSKGSPERSITTKDHKHSAVRNSTMKQSPSRNLTTVNDSKPDFERKSNSIIVESGQTWMEANDEKHDYITSKLEDI